MTFSRFPETRSFPRSPTHGATFPPPHQDMGIQSLLPLIKPALQQVSLSEFKGKRVGVDGNIWIHRGLFTCAVDLACGEEPDAYIKYCSNCARLLLDHGITPLVVFDGRALAAKGDTSAKRNEGRQQARSEMDGHLEALRELELQRESRPHDKQLEYDMAAIRQKMERAAQSAVKVTQQMVERVMGALRLLGVAVLRAPNEADAQLAFLARHRKVDAVLTEDSDLVAYACPCVLVKLDRHAGTVQRLLWDDLGTVTVSGSGSLKGLTESMFLELCILCGCDYLDNIKGVGPKTALKLMLKLKDGKRVITHLRSHAPNGVRVPEGYTKRFADALVTFRHQRVWSPVQRALVHLTPLPDPLPDDLLADEVDALCGAPMEAAAAATWVYAGAPPPRDDPFSMAAAMSSTVGGGLARPSANPFHVVRRVDGAPLRARDGPTGSASSSARQVPVLSAALAEAEALVGSAAKERTGAPGGDASVSGGGRRKRIPQRSPMKGSPRKQSPSRSSTRPTCMQDQFEDEEGDEGGAGVAWSFDPMYSQRPPAPPAELAEEDVQDGAPPEGSRAASGAERVVEVDDEHVDDDDEMAPRMASAARCGAPAWSRRVYRYPEQEQSAEEYLAQAAQHGAQHGSGDAELLPPPEKRFVRGSPERGLSSALHRQAAVRAKAPPSPSHRNPFAAKAPKEVKLPLGNGRIDPLHPLGALAPRTTAALTPAPVAPALAELPSRSSAEEWRASAAFVAPSPAAASAAAERSAARRAAEAPRRVSPRGRSSLGLAAQAQGIAAAASGREQSSASGTIQGVAGSSETSAAVSLGPAAPYAPHAQGSRTSALPAAPSAALGKRPTPSTSKVAGKVKAAISGQKRKSGALTSSAPPQKAQKTGPSIASFFQASA